MLLRSTPATKLISSSLSICIKLKSSSDKIFVYSPVLGISDMMAFDIISVADIGSGKKPSEAKISPKTSSFELKLINTPWTSFGSLEVCHSATFLLLVKKEQYYTTEKVL